MSTFSPPNSSSSTSARPWEPSSTHSGFNPPQEPVAEPFPFKLRPSPQPTPRTRRSRVINVLLAVTAGVCVIAAAALVFKVFAPDAFVEAPLPASEFDREADGVAVGATGDDAVEVDGVPMTVADMAPNSMLIPELAVYLPVEAGSTFTSTFYPGFDAIRVPKDPKHGVWYSDGAPMVGAEAGTTLIASHVARTTGWGALRPLYTLQGGEMVYTKDSEGAVQEWQITTMRVEDHTDFPQEYWAADGERQLVITTCGGRVTSKGQFSQNIFAIAKPIEPPSSGEEPVEA